ncbi:DMT family transporter, partial [Thermoplasma sp.]|uniref:DMT family transporter n=1 Tax=Thermoplasma sp. TaxID=1973142 RepID=UPI0012829C39
VFWGLVPVVSILVGFPSPVFVFFRVLISLLFFYAIYRGKLRMRDLTRWPVLFSGILLGVNWISFFYAVSIMPVSMAVVLYYSGPAIAIYLSFLIGERPNRLAMAGGSFSFAAMAIMFMQSLHVNLAGFSIALISGVSYAMIALVSRKAVDHVRSSDLVIYQTIIVLVMTAPFLAMMRFSMSYVKLSLLIFAGIFQTGIALLLWYDSQRRIGVQTASVLSYLDPVFAVIFALLILGQRPDMLTVISISMILASGFAVSFANIRASRKILENKVT